MEHINTKAEFNRQQAVIQYLKIRILIILKWSITFTPTNEKRFFRFFKANISISLMFPNGFILMCLPSTLNLCQLISLNRKELEKPNAK